MTAFVTPRFVGVIRIVATTMMLSIGGLFVVLWFRNLWRADVAWAPLPGSGHVLFASQDGQTEVALSLPSKTSKALRSGPTSPGWGAQSYAATPKSISQILFAQAKPFRYRRMWNSRELNMIAPYWFLVPLTWLLAVAPWVRWSTRFSLRALLVATTIAAMALGVSATSKW
jgi:hypothetical protein